MKKYQIQSEGKMHLIPLLHKSYPSSHLSQSHV